MHLLKLFEYNLYADNVLCKIKDNCKDISNAVFLAALLSLLLPCWSVIAMTLCQFWA